MKLIVEIPDSKQGQAFLKSARALPFVTKAARMTQQETAALIGQLETDPVSIADAALGKRCYKIRVAIASKGTGKSDGARVIYYVSIVNDTAYLLSVFNKADAENIPAKEIEKVVVQSISFK